MLDPSVVVIIQARMESTRLPGKALEDLGGAPLTLHVVERARAAGYLTALAVPNTIPNNDLVARVREADPTIHIYRGEHEDVVRRYVGCAAYLSVGDPLDKLTHLVVVRVTGDCPLLDPAEIVRAVKLVKEGKQFVALCRYPGLDVEAFPFYRLWEADLRSTQREHVGLAVADLLGVGAPRYVELPVVGQNVPWLAVDTEDDLARVRQVVAHLPSYGDLTREATLTAWMKAGRP